jgi:hypothetical protein
MRRLTSPSTHDPLRVGIDGKGHINEARLGRDVSEVRYPQLGAGG